MLLKELDNALARLVYGQAINMRIVRQATCCTNLQALVRTRQIVEIDKQVILLLLQTPQLGNGFSKIGLELHNVNLRVGVHFAQERIRVVRVLVALRLGAAAGSGAGLRRILGVKGAIERVRGRDIKNANAQWAVACLGDS